MRVLTLFELFLVIFTFYAILKYEGGMRILVPILCLVTMFLFERFRKIPEKDEKTKKGTLKHNRIQYKEYSLEECKIIDQQREWDE